jgi:hypothetical protein
MGRGLDRVVSPSTKNLSFVDCEPFFSGQAKPLDGLAGKGLFRYDSRQNEAHPFLKIWLRAEEGEGRPR